MRLFVAVDVPERVKAALEAAVVDPLRAAVAGARWTRPEGRHLTLKFLGEVPDERVAAVAGALHGAASGHSAYDASFERLGCFPNPRRARVLWVGLGEGAERTAAVAESVESALGPLGFPRESRRFTAHLTLARFKVPGPVGELDASAAPADRFVVDEIVLFRSQLHPHGARYTALERFRLGG